MEREDKVTYSLTKTVRYEAFEVTVDMSDADPNLSEEEFEDLAWDRVIEKVNDEDLWQEMDTDIDEM